MENWDRPFRSVENYACWPTNPLPPRCAGTPGRGSERGRASNRERLPRSEPGPKGAPQASGPCHIASDACTALTFIPFGGSPRHMAPPLAVAALLLIALLPLTGCRSEPVAVHPQGNDAPPLASSIHMSDARIESQLVSGFYGVEQNVWRWTARQFSVLLRPPVGSAKKGATLELRLTVPPVVTEKLNAVTLSAAAGGKPLPPETYTQPGDYVYSRDIPPNLLADEVLRVDFSLDKSIPPSGADLRELGVIVLSAGLTPK